MHNIMFLITYIMGFEDYILNFHKNFDLTWKTLELVNYENALIYFYCIILVERILLMKRKEDDNLMESIISFNHGVLHEIVRLLTYHFEMPLYTIIYENTGKIILSGYSVEQWTWTNWCLSFLAVDFFYYWAHRLSHEIHFLWAFHQVHHSSEQFDFTVGVRKSVVEYFIQSVFYLPLVVFLNPYYIMKSRELISLYQLYLHTELVDGPQELEWIFNTPKHHRVHHSCNKHYMDKNYGGVLIIWDRMFSTFTENNEMAIIYGLEISPEYSNVCYQQIIGFINLIRKSSGMDNTIHKLATFVMGPRWFPGEPRLGNKNKIRTRLVNKVNNIPKRWHLLFTSIMHCTITINGYEMYLIRDMDLLRIFDGFGNIIISFCICGLFFDGCNIVVILLTEFSRWTMMVFVYYEYPQLCMELNFIFWKYYALYFSIIVFNVFNVIKLLISDYLNQ